MEAEIDSSQADIKHDDDDDDDGESTYALSVII